MALVFFALYLFSTFLIVPFIAPWFGREKIDDTAKISAHNFITKLCNRNYVTPNLNEVLKNISLQLNKKHPDIKVIYLDANFPFIDKFPLLPHLSHNDGKKIDIAFIYKNNQQKISNLKPSRSGYGVFEAPLKTEINQPLICKKKNYCQYDFTKHLTFGIINNQLSLDTEANATLIQIIANNPKVSKVFIEPHLKTRMKLHNSKIRYHGCKAVRHDDHIHFQIK